MRSWIILAFVLTVLAVGATGLWWAPRITEVFLYLQDIPVLGVCLIFWLAVPWAARRGRLGDVAISPRTLALGAAVTAGAVALIGSQLVYRGYALSMDEFMATFDATTFQHGHLAAPLEPAWRPFAFSLQPIFLREYPGHAFWTSGYLPVSAAFRSVFALLGVPALTNAVWAALAVVSTFGVARRLWPERPDAAVVASLLLASSSQVLITAMTPYAMTAHLALNMAWLWLFLRRERLSDVAAGAVGLLATGLHQIVFHPLFAAPFVLQLWIGRQWGRAAFYTVLYVCIGLFWSMYWSLAQAMIGAASQVSVAAGGSAVDQAADLVAKFDVDGLGMMVKNLVRFVAWQNPLAVALTVFGLVTAVRASSVMRALVAGFVLTVAAMFVLLPFQGHGWGYRYVHGLLGSLCLVAAHGWTRLTSGPSAPEAAPMRTLLAAACAFSMLVLLPIRAWQAGAWVAPYAEATRRIKATRSDIVFVDPRGLWYGDDLVRNDPFLRNTPKVLTLDTMNAQKVAYLCRRYRVAVFDKTVGRPLGIRPSGTPPVTDRKVEALRALMRELSCGEGQVAR